MSKTKTFLSRLFRDERGNVGMLFAMSAVPVIGMAGMAVDYGRTTQVQAQVQAAVDAAAVTAVRADNMTEEDRIAAARQVFLANIEGMSAATLSIEPTITPTDGGFTVSAEGTVLTTLTALFGIPSLPVAATAKATRSSGNQTEVALMIDLTGSMGDTRNGQTKIDGLRTAGADLLNILLPNGTNTLDTRVSIVPFADYVNAGDFAATVTGLPSRGPYALLKDLGALKNAAFGGTYSGVTGNEPGSLSGVTPQGITYPGQTSPAGTVYQTTPPTPATPTTTCTTTVTPTSTLATILTHSAKNAGIFVSTGSYAGTAPPGLKKATSGTPAYHVYGYGQTCGGNQWEYGDGYDFFSGVPRDLPPRTTGYYVPFIKGTSASTMVKQTRTAPAYDKYGVGIGDRSGPIGVFVNTHSWLGPDSITGHGWSTYPNNPALAKPTNVPYPAVYAPNTAEKGYWALLSFSSTGVPKYEWTTKGHYIPVYQDLHLQTITQSCATSGTSDPTGNLISCVTERTGSQKYTEESPSTAFVGTFNRGDSSISNYSSDGMCWAAGRELPEVIPLTNDKDKLDDFFQNAQFGGGAPGHLGTAWAWYTLSPKWSSVWPSASRPAAYESPNVSKAAVIVTDGEYNMEYSSDASRTQALALCQAMKDKGITIYTVGYGLSTSASPSDSTADGKAKDLLTQCATSPQHAFFPYDGSELRQTVSQIGQALKSTSVTSTARVQ